MPRLSLPAIGVAALMLGALPAAHAKTVTIEGKDTMAFSMDAITVQPGEEVTVKLVNKSEMPPQAMSHNWVLLAADADVDAFNAAALGARDNDYIPSDLADQALAHTAMVGGGESDTITFTAPETPGDYTYLCTFPGHFAAGMKGTLTVEDGG